jgi:hypothetical protein
VLCDGAQIELGVFLDHIFLGLLESTHTTQEQKKDILELFLHILATPSVRHLTPSHLTCSL